MWRWWLWWGIVLPLWAGPNQVEEARLMMHLAEDLHQGRVVRIPLGAGDFLAVHDLARTRKVRGVVVFLPEAGARADSPIAAALRTYLPAHGWEVLSLQLPVLEPEAGPEEYQALLPHGSTRLKAAVGWLRSRGGGNIATVGHGWGGLVLLEYLAKPDPRIGAAVLLSLAWPKPAGDQVRAWLQAVPVPVLDVYAEQDHPEVKAVALERHLLLKGKTAYRQIRFSAADHYYRARGELLAKRIDGWLRRVVPGENSDE